MVEYRGDFSGDGRLSDFSFRINSDEADSNESLQQGKLSVTFTGPGGIERTFDMKCSKLVNVSPDGAVLEQQAHKIYTSAIDLIKSQGEILGPILNPQGLIQSDFPSHDQRYLADAKKSLKKHKLSYVSYRVKLKSDAQEEPELIKTSLHYKTADQETLDPGVKQVLGDYAAAKNFKAVAESVNSFASKLLNPTDEDEEEEVEHVDVNAAAIQSLESLPELNEDLTTLSKQMQGLLKRGLDEDEDKELYHISSRAYLTGLKNHVEEIESLPEGEQLAAKVDALNALVLFSSSINSEYLTNDQAAELSSHITASMESLDSAVDALAPEHASAMIPVLSGLKTDVDSLDPDKSLKEPILQGLNHKIEILKEKLPQDEATTAEKLVALKEQVSGINLEATDDIAAITTLATQLTKCTESIITAIKSDTSFDPEVQEALDNCIAQLSEKYSLLLDKLPEAKKPHLPDILDALTKKAKREIAASNPYSFKLVSSLQKLRKSIEGKLAVDENSNQEEIERLKNEFNNAGDIKEEGEYTTRVTSYLSGLKASISKASRDSKGKEPSQVIANAFLNLTALKDFLVRLDQTKVAEGQKDSIDKTVGDILKEALLSITSDLCTIQMNDTDTENLNKRIASTKKALENIVVVDDVDDEEDEGDEATLSFKEELIKSFKEALEKIKEKIPEKIAPEGRQESLLTIKKAGISPENMRAYIKGLANYASVNESELTKKLLSSSLTLEDVQAIYDAIDSLKLTEAQIASIKNRPSEALELYSSGLKSILQKCYENKISDIEEVIAVGSPYDFSSIDASLDEASAKALVKKHNDLTAYLSLLRENDDGDTDSLSSNDSEDYTIEDLDFDSSALDDLFEAAFEAPEGESKPSNYEAFTSYLDKLEKYLTDYELLDSPLVKNEWCCRALLDLHTRLEKGVDDRGWLFKLSKEEIRVVEAKLVNCVVILEAKVASEPGSSAILASERASIESFLASKNSLLVKLAPSRDIINKLERAPRVLPEAINFTEEDIELLRGVGSLTLENKGELLSTDSKWFQLHLLFKDYQKVQSQLKKLEPRAKAKGADEASKKEYKELQEELKKFKKAIKASAASLSSACGARSSGMFGSSSFFKADALIKAADSIATSPMSLPVAIVMMQKSVRDPSSLTLSTASEIFEGVNDNPCLYIWNGVDNAIVGESLKLLESMSYSDSTLSKFATDFEHANKALACLELLHSRLFYSYNPKEKPFMQFSGNQAVLESFLAKLDALDSVEELEELGYILKDMPGGGSRAVPRSRDHNVATDKFLGLMDDIRLKINSYGVDKDTLKSKQLAYLDEIVISSLFYKTSAKMKTEPFKTILKNDASIERAIDKAPKRAALVFMALAQKGGTVGPDVEKRLFTDLSAGMKLNVATEFKNLRSQYPKYFSLEKIASTFIDEYNVEEVLAKVRGEVKAAYQEHISAIDSHGSAKFEERLEAINNLDTLKALKSLLESRASNITIISPLQLEAFEILEDLYLSDGLCPISEKESLKTSMDSSILEHFKRLELDKKDPYQEVLQEISQTDQKVAIARYAFSLADVEGGTFPTTQKLPDYDNLLYAMNLAIVIKAVSQRGVVSSECQAYVDKMKEEVFSAENKIPEDIADERLSDICSYGATNEFLQALPDLLGSDAISEDSKGKLKAIAVKLQAYLITEGSYGNLSEWATSDLGGVDGIVDPLKLDRLENFQKLQVALSLYENRAALALDFPREDVTKIEERRRELLIALPQVGQSADTIKNDYKLAYNMFAILDGPTRDRENDFETIKAFVAAYHELELSDRAIIAELLNPDTQDGSIEVSYHLREWLKQNCPSDLIPVHEKMEEKMIASVKPFEYLVPELQAKLGGDENKALDGVTLLQTKAQALKLEYFLSGSPLEHGFNEISSPEDIFDFLKKFNQFKSLSDKLDKGKSQSVERAVHDLVKEKKAGYEETLKSVQEAFSNAIVKDKNLPSNRSSDTSRKAVVVALLDQEYSSKEEFLKMYHTLCAAYSPVEELITREGDLDGYLTRDKFEALVAKLDGRARRRGFIKNELNSLYDRIDEQSSRIKLENQLKAGLFSGVSEDQLTALLAPFLGTLENRETLTKILDYLGSEEGVLASDLPALSVDQLKALSALLELNTQEELKQRKNDLFAALFEKIQEDRSLTTSLSSSTRKHSQFTDNKFLFVLAHLSSKDPSFHGLLAAKLSANSSLARSWDMELGKLTEDLESGESKLSERDLQKVTDLFTSFALLLKGNAIPDGYTEFEERLKRGTGEEKAAGSFLDARSGFEAEGGLKGQIKWMEQEDREFVLTCLMAANESEEFKLGDLSHIDTSAFDSDRIKALIKAFDQSLSVASSKADDAAEHFLKIVLQKLHEHFSNSSENINKLLTILKPAGTRDQVSLLDQLGDESTFSTSLGDFKYQLEFLASQDGEDQSYYMAMQQALQASTAEDTTVDKVRFTSACLAYVKLYDYIAAEFPSDNKDEILEKFQAVVSSFQEKAVDLEGLEELLDAAPDNKIEFNLSISQALRACRNITSFDSRLLVEDLRARMEVSGEAFPKLEEDHGSDSNAMTLIKNLRGQLDSLQLNTLKPASGFDDVKVRYDDGNFEGGEVVNFLRHYADIKKLAAYIASQKKVENSVWNTKKSTAQRAAVDAVAGDIQSILDQFDENYIALKEKLSDAGLADFAPVLDSLVAVLESIDPNAESNANSTLQLLTFIFDLHVKKESTASFFKGSSSLREHFQAAAENGDLLELEDKYLFPLEYGTFKGKLTSEPISLKSSNKFLKSLDADYNYFNNTIKAKERLRSFCELQVVKISSSSDPAFNALIDLCFDHPDRDEAMMEGFSDIVEFLKDTSRELDLKAFHGTNLWEALPHIINLIKDPTAKKALIDKYIAACASIGERAARSDVKNFKKEFGDGESAELEQSIKLLHFLGSFKDTTKKAVLTQQMLEIFPEFSQNIQKLFTESLSPIIFKKSDGTASSKKPSDGLVVIQGEVVAMQTSLIQAKLGAISGIDEVIDPSKKANLVLLLKEGNSPEDIQAILQIISDPTEENLDSLEITSKTLSILLELRSFVKDSKRADFIKVANKYIEQSTSPSYSGNEAREAEFGGYYKQCLKELFDGESPAFFSTLQTSGDKGNLAAFYRYLPHGPVTNFVSTKIVENFEKRLLLAYGASIPAALDFIDGTNPDPNSFVLTDEELKDEELFPIVLSLSKEKCDKDESFTELNALRQGVIDGNITVADIKAGPESALRFHLAIDNARKELREHGLSNEEDLKLFSDKFRDGLETHPDKELITDCTLTRPGGEKLAVPRGFINTLQLLDDALHDHSIAYQGGESTATAITAYFGSLKDRVEEESELKELQSLENEDLRDGVTASMLSSALEAETIDENVKVAFLSLLKNNAIDLNNPSCIDELKVAIGDNPGNQKAFINYYISLLTKTAGRNKTHELAKALQKPMQHLLKAWDNESALEVFLDAFKSNNSDSFKVVGSITEGVIRERPIFSGASEEALNDLFQITSTSISRQKDTLATLERFTRGSLKDDFDQLAGLVLEETNRPKKAAKIAVLEKLLKLVTGDFEEEKGILEQLKLGAKTLQDAKEKYAALASEDAALTAVLGTGEVKFEDETAGTYHSKGLPTSLMIQFSQLIDVAEGTAEERSLTLDDSSTKTISKEAAATFRSLLEATLKIPETNTDNLKTLFSSLLSIKKVAAGVQKRIDEQKSIKELIEGLETLVPEDKKETDFYRALQAIKGKIDDELKVEALTLSVNIKGNSSGSLPKFSKEYTVQGHKEINRDVLVNLLNSAESESGLTTLGELFRALGEAAEGADLDSIVSGKNPENSPLKEALDEFKALGFKVYRRDKEVRL